MIILLIVLWRALRSWPPQLSSFQTKNWLKQRCFKERKWPSSPLILLPAECCAFFCYSKYYLSGTSACLAVNIFYVFLSVLAKPKLTVVRSASLTFSVSVLEVKWEVQSWGKSHQSCYFYLFVLLMLRRDLLKLYWAYFPRQILALKFHNLLSVLLDSWFIMYTCSIGAENLSITRISALTLFLMDRERWLTKCTCQQTDYSIQGDLYAGSNW